MSLDTTYDSQLSTLSGLNWLPWIGEHYHNKKILLVGESHYDDNEGWLQDQSATRNFVNNQGLNSHNPDFKKRRFFQQIEKTLLNKESSSLEERSRIWKSVAFFNLVQRLLPTSGHRPTKEDYDKAWRTFLSVADVIRPNIAIKYGYEGIGRLGYLLHNFDTGWERDNRQEFYTRPFCINLTKNDYRLKIIFIYHPTGSRGFYYDVWAEHIRNKYPNINNLLN